MGKKWKRDLFGEVLEDQEEKFETKLFDVKDDFYNKIDLILKEIMTSQEERTILSHHVSDHEDRIEKIEKKFNIQPFI